MPRPALSVKVSKKDQAALKKILAAGVAQVRVTLRAVALQRLGEGMSAPRIAAVLPLTRQSVRNLARRYQQGGLERALHDKQRPGVLTGHIVNRIDRGHGEHISGEEDVLVEDVLYALGRNQHHDRENEIHQ